MDQRTGPSRRAPLLWLVLALAAIVMASCGDDDATIDASVVDRGGPVPIDLNRLTNGTWSLRFGGGPEGDVELVDGFPITITFDGDGSFGGTAACNGYGGRWTIDGARLTLGEIGSTDAGCQDAVLLAESRYLAALLDVDGINLVGDELALSGMATELIFGSRSAAPIDRLVGPTWLLEATLADGVATPVEGEPATLTVRDDGTFDGSTGCRTLTGRYTVFGNEVLFNEMAADGDCPASLFDQDSSVIAVLGDGFTAEIDGDQMLLASMGNEGLQYRAVTADELAAIEPGGVVTDAEALEGVPWVFVGGDGPNGPIADPRTIDPDATITLTFEGGGYSGRVVCNTYGGTADIDRSLWSFSLGPAAATEIACGQPFDDPDGPVAAYLSAIGRMTEGGFDDELTTLVMNDGETELQFERLAD